MPKLTVFGFDTTLERISQARGVLTALMANYTEQPLAGMRHVLGPAALLETLDAARELIDQAHGALADHAREE